MSFEVGDKKILNVTPIKGILRFEKERKLRSRFIDPFEILKIIGNVAHCQALPSELSVVHNVFHSSMLRKYLHNPIYVVKC